MDYVFLILAILFALTGLAGVVLPVIPGPPISYIALLFLLALPTEEANWIFLLATGILAVLITVLDYIVPIYGTKKLGGTKYGIWGSTIGLVVGMFVLPLLGIVIGPFGLIGIIAGPFVGAYIGEIIAKNNEKALKAAWGSFLGFLASTFLKVAYGIFVLVMVIISSVEFFSN